MELIIYTSGTVAVDDSSVIISPNTVGVVGLPNGAFTLGLIQTGTNMVQDGIRTMCNVNMNFQTDPSTGK